MTQKQNISNMSHVAKLSVVKKLRIFVSGISPVILTNASLFNTSSINCSLIVLFLSYLAMFGLRSPQTSCFIKSVKSFLTLIC